MIESIKTWRFRAKCRNEDTSFFFQDQGSFLIPAFCADCPVRRNCLEYALVHNEDGWWGGVPQNVRRNRKIYPKSEILSLRERYKKARLLEQR